MCASAVFLLFLRFLFLFFLLTSWRLELLGLSQCPSSNRVRVKSRHFLIVCRVATWLGYSPGLDALNWSARLSHDHLWLVGKMVHDSAIPTLEAKNSHGIGFTFPEMWTVPYLCLIWKFELANWPVWSNNLSPPQKKEVKCNERSPLVLISTCYFPSRPQNNFESVVALHLQPVN